VSPLPRIGTKIGNYRVVDFIAQGGMGAVYVAEHQLLPRTVALKVLLDELREDGQFRARFQREARLLETLSEHPHIVRIHDAGEEKGLLYIAMRYVDGMTLRELLRTERVVEPGRAIRIAAQIASALDTAHAANLVHRDVKPENVLIENRDGGDYCYLSDFGLVRDTTSSTRLTGTRVTLGTARYMAPEQVTADIIQGSMMDGRVDVYALGAVLFECLTGVRPFADKTTLDELFTAHLFAVRPFASSLNSDLPREIDAVLAKAMAIPRNDRFATCGELVDAAAAVLSYSDTAPAPPPQPDTAPAPPPQPDTAPAPPPQPDTAPAPPPQPDTAPAPPPQPETGAPATRRNRRRIMALAAAAFLLAGLLTVIAFALDKPQGVLLRDGTAKVAVSGLSSVSVLRFPQCCTDQVEDNYIPGEHLQITFDEGDDPTPNLDISTGASVGTQTGSFSLQFSRITFFEGLLGGDEPKCRVTITEASESRVAGSFRCPQMNGVANPDKPTNKIISIRGTFSASP
jgi:serine/threonine protein kinase